VELLHTYTDLLRWAWTAGALTREEARALRRQGEAHPRRAARDLREAVALREATAAIFLAGGRGGDLPAGPLAQLDRVCRAARAAQRLEPRSGGVVWSWRSAVPEPERPMWAAALDASAILTSPDLERVRQCGDSECGWLFLDTSRNRSRRWCSMESCGNRNKARSFYRRSRSG
jgi:predicted RNA-binding Zn ribbon-like protein